MKWQMFPIISDKPTDANSQQRREYSKRTAVDCRSLNLIQRSNDNETEVN